MKKKLLSLICMALFAGVTVNAEIYSGYCSETLNWTLDSETGVLELVPSGDATELYMNNLDWRSDQYRSLIKTVILPEGLQSIYSYAFEYCNNLSSINIPSTVTSIGYETFYGCNRLFSLTIPASVTYLGEYPFPSNITLIFEGNTPPSLNGYIYFSAAYVPQEALSAYKEAWPNNANDIFPNIPDDHRELTVTARTDNKSAIHVALGDADLEKVTSLKVNGTINSYDIMIIRNKMVNLRELDLTDVIIVANKYEYYTGICSVDSVLTAHAFDNSRIQVAKLPKVLKRIEESPFNPKTIREVEINSGNIADKAFINCFNLQKVTIENCDSIGEFAFMGSGLTLITIPASIRYIGKFAFAGIDQNYMSNFDCSYARAHNFTPVEQHDGYIEYEDRSYYMNNIILQPGKNYVLWYDNVCYPAERVDGNEWRFWNGVEWTLFYNWDYPVVSFTSFNNQLTIVNEYSLSFEFRYGEGNRYYYYCEDRCRGGHLQSVEFEKGSLLTEFEPCVFSGNEELTNIVFPENLQFIGYEALGSCAVDSLVIPETVFYVDNFAFTNSKCRYIVLPQAIEGINPYTFYGSQNLLEVKVPSSIRTIGDYAFDKCPNIKSVYTYTVEPTQINQQTFSCWQNANLYVPKTSYYTYYYNTQWSQFLKLIPFEEDYDYFYVNDDYELGGDDIITGQPDADLNPGSGFVVTGDTPQEMGEITQHITQSLSASIVACEQSLLSSKLRIKVSMESGVWYFLCFPFDLPLSSIAWLGQFAIYEYNGAIRAANGSGGWVKNTASTLSAGKGYIFQSAISGDIEFTIPNPVFSCNLVEQLLPVYAASAAYDANWTLIGNPFPAYFDMDELFSAGFNAPVYVRSKDRDDYDVYMPHDDEYHFHPYEAFFVQNPGDVAGVINWNADGRETLKQAQEKSNKPARRMAVQDNRHFVELRLASEDLTQGDHTRVVFNDEAQMAYELGRDAVKMAGKAPVRLYSLDSETQYAINERPAENGYVQLGFSVAKDGDYVLSASRLDASVTIYDNVEKQEVDLTLGDYHFHAKAGVDNERFAISRIKQAVTSIDELSNVIEGKVNVYSISGILMAEQVELNELQLPAGAYVFQSDKMTRTVILK